MNVASDNQENSCEVSAFRHGAIVHSALLNGRSLLLIFHRVLTDNLNHTNNRVVQYLCVVFK